MRIPRPAILLGALLLLGWWQMKRVKDLFEGIRHFKPKEFGADVLLVDRAALVALDAFREYINAPCVLSDVEGGGLIRKGEGTSQHYFGRAFDLRWPVYGEDHPKRGQRVPFAVLEAARLAAGFTGFGLYSWGIHVDKRPDHTPDNPARWAWVYDAAGNHTEVSQTDWLATTGRGMGVA